MQGTLGHAWGRSPQALGTLANSAALPIPLTPAGRRGRAGSSTHLAKCSIARGSAAPSLQAATASLPRASFNNSLDANPWCSTDQWSRPVPCYGWGNTCQLIRRGRAWSSLTHWLGGGGFPVGSTGALQLAPLAVEAGWAALGLLSSVPRRPPGHTRLNTAATGTSGKEMMGSPHRGAPPRSCLACLPAESLL